MYTQFASVASQLLVTKEKKETKEKVLEETDEKIYELPDPPKLELGDGLANVPFQKIILEIPKNMKMLPLKI